MKKIGRPPLLTPAEEHLLVNFINDGNARAMPVTKQVLIDTVKDILKEDKQRGYNRGYKFPDSDLEGWCKGFRKRNPKVTIRTPETLTSSRRNLSVGLIKQWYSDTKSYLVDRGNADILNDNTR